MAETFRRPSRNGFLPEARHCRLSEGNVRVSATSTLDKDFGRGVMTCSELSSRVLPGLERAACRRLRGTVRI